MDQGIFLVQDDAHGQAALSAVGRIESPPGTPRGTGLLVGRQLLLTCKHVVERIFYSGIDRLWVRFGYRTGEYGVESGEMFELDLKHIVANNAQPLHALDYTLMRIIGEPAYAAASLSHGKLDRTQSVRIIYHPRGEPAQISEVGQIIDVAKEYIQHNLKTDYGSSGAPIFDLEWHVVAIHRGKLRLSRSYPPGVTEGIPISSIWNDINSHFAA